MSNPQTRAGRTSPTWADLPDSPGGNTEILVLGEGGDKDVAATAAAAAAAGAGEQQETGATGKLETPEVAEDAAATGDEPKSGGRRSTLDRILGGEVS